MRRRICLVGAPLSVISLAFGVAAATASKSKTTKTKPIAVTCRTAIAVTIAPGDTVVTPPDPQGAEYGSAACNKLFGNGVQADHFTVPGSGDTLANYTWYFRTGTLKGTYDLTPQEGSLGTGFTSASYLGTLKVIAGTGALKGYTGTGTMTCATPDGIHTSCTNKLKLKLPKA